MSRLGLLPRVIWPIGESSEADAVLRPGRPALPWLNGWVPDGVAIGTSVRWAFEAVQPLAQMLVMAGYRIGDAYLVRGSTSLHFDGDDRSVDDEVPPLLGPTQVDAEILFRVEPLAYVPTDDSRSIIAIPLTLPNGTELDPTLGSETWLSLDVTGAATLDGVSSVLDAWSTEAADSVADQIAVAYSGPSTTDGLLGVFVHPLSFDLEILAPEQAGIVQKAVYNAINTYSGRPDVVPLVAPLAAGQLELMLADERADTPVPMSQRLIEYFESAGGSRQIDRVRNEQKLQSAADAVGFDHRRETLFTVVLKLHDTGLADVLGGFATPAASDWPWLLERLDDVSALSPADVERVADVLAAEETQDGTIRALIRLRDEYATTFETDSTTQSAIRSAFINAIGQAPLTPGDHGDAELFAHALFALLEPGDDSVDLAAVTAAIEDTWVQWQIAREGAWERNLRATALFVFGTAPVPIRVTVLTECTAHFLPMLSLFRFNIGESWTADPSFGVASDDHDGWTHSTSRAFVAMWTLLRDNDGAGPLPSPDELLTIVGSAPFDDFDEDLYRIAYQERIGNSQVPALTETMHAFRALDDYSTAVHNADLSFCRRFNTQPLNDRLAVLLADAAVASEFSAARLAGVRAAKDEPTLTPTQLIDRHLGWCSDALTVGYWIGLTGMEQAAAKERWRERLHLIDPQQAAEFEAGIAHLDLVAGASGIIESMADTDIDFLFDDPFWMPVSNSSLSTGKQLLKLAKARTGLGKVVHLTQLTNFATTNRLVPNVAASQHVARWTNRATFEVILRDLERKPLLSPAPWNDVTNFRNSVKDDILGQYQSTGAASFDMASRSLSGAVAVFAAYQFVARLEDVYWTGLEVSDVTGGVGELRDMVGGALDVALIWKEPLKQYAAGFGALSGRSANWLLTTGPIWMSYVSNAVSAVKYFVDAYEAFERGEYVSMLVFATASSASLTSIGLMAAGMVGAAGVVGLGTALLITVHMVVRDWYRDWIDQLGFQELMTREAILVSSLGTVTLPVGASIPEILVDQNGTVLDSSVGVVVVATSPMTEISPQPGVWGNTGPGVVGAVQTNGVATPRNAQTGTHVEWELSCPFPGRLETVLVGQGTVALDDIRPPGAPVFTATPECEVWYDAPNGGVFDLLQVETGATVEIGDVLALVPGDDDVVATRAGDVYLIDDRVPEDGLDPEYAPYRIRVRTRR